MHEGDRALEHVVLFGSRMRRVDAEQAAQVEQETLRSRQFRRFDAVPFVDECLR
jgi:hypothetical protein